MFFGELTNYEICVGMLYTVGVYLIIERRKIQRRLNSALKDIANIDDTTRYTCMYMYTYPYTLYTLYALHTPYMYTCVTYVCLFFLCSVTMIVRLDWNLYNS